MSERQTNEYYININSKKWKVKVEEEQYVILKYGGMRKRKNQETHKEEEYEFWEAYRYPTTLNQLIRKLTKFLTMEKLERDFKKDKKGNCVVTLKEYLTLINKTQKEIEKELGDY